MGGTVKNILLTGGTGFLGSNILARLLSEGCHVAAIKRSGSDTWRIKDWLTHSNLSLYDIDQVDPRIIFEKNKIDLIVHTATEYGRGDTQVSKILAANLILPIRLIDLGIEYGVTCFLNTDSFFNKKGNSHASLLNYSLSKKSLLLWFEHLSKKIRVINIMLEHVYGPYDSQSKFVEYLIQQIAVERVPRIALSPGNQKRDFVYVEDVVDAYMCLMQYGLGNEFSCKEFQVGSGASVQVRDFVEVIRKVAGSKTVLGYGDIPYGKNETMDSAAEILLLTGLGWAPKTTIEMGVSCILKTYGEYRSDL